MSEQKIIDALTGVIERNTDAMNRNAEASDKMAEQVKGLRATIQGAQRKIGGELGPIIVSSKLAAKKLHEEAEAAVRARDNGGT